LTDRRVLLQPALLLALRFAPGLPPSRHSPSDTGSSSLSGMAGWALLAPASPWGGGLVDLDLGVRATGPAPAPATILPLTILAPRPGDAALGRSRRTCACLAGRPAAAPTQAPGTSPRARATRSRGTRAALVGGRRHRSGFLRRPSSARAGAGARSRRTAWCSA